MAHKIQPFIQQDMMLVEEPELSAGVYQYRKMTPCQLFLSPSTTVYIAVQSSMATFSKLFQFAKRDKAPRTTCFQYERDTRFQEQLGRDEGYQNYVKQAFYSAKQASKTLSTLQISVEKVRQICISESQLLTKQGQPDAPRERCLFIDFRTSDGKQTQILLQGPSFNVDAIEAEQNLTRLVENIRLRALLFASGSATLRSSIQLIRNLELSHVDFNLPQHLGALQLAAVPVARFLRALHGAAADGEDAVTRLCVTPTQDHLFWRRIGFQGTKPQSDFRAAGLLGILAIAYTAFFSPDFLVNASYPGQLGSPDAVEAYLQQKGKVPYGYPIAISVISCAHAIITSDQVEKLGTEQTSLFRVLTNDYIADYIYIINNAAKVAQRIRDILVAGQLQTITAPELSSEPFDAAQTAAAKETAIQQYLELLDRISVKMQSNEINIESVMEEVVQFNNGGLQFLPLQPLFMDDRVLSSLNPQMCGCFLKLICYMCLELNRRLSSYDAATQYMNYAGQFQVVLEDLKQVLHQDDVLGVDDLLLRMKKTW